MSISRRNFISSMGALGAASFISEQPVESFHLKTFPFSCNQYAWYTFYKRENKDWFANLDASLADYASSGLTAFEPGINNADEVKKLLPLLKKHHLSMPSIYTGTSLHKADEAQQSIQSVLAIADSAYEAGTNIIVTNPDPIDWGGNKNKSDAELIEQAANLDKLGAALKRKGITLAYHMHDMELKMAARELHHMLQATDARHVSLCLDVHWVYRGSGNSQVALFDIINLYGKRIAELHIRQSKDGTWQETFGEGDIDYRRIAKTLTGLNVRPHLVLEQCLESKSPDTMNAVAAHKLDLIYAREIFGNWYQ
jgi:inosose dehydratase